jgi:folate-dependent tRNA-U54 methylase TrmFO/GidA
VRIKDKKERYKALSERALEKIRRIANSQKQEVGE